MDSLEHRRCVTCKDTWPTLCVYHTHGGKRSYKGHVLNLPQNIQDFLTNRQPKLHNLHSSSEDKKQTTPTRIVQLEGTRCLERSHGQQRIRTTTILTLKLTRKHQLMVSKDICPHFMTHMQTLSPWSSWIESTWKTWHSQHFSRMIPECEFTL